MNTTPFNANGQYTSDIHVQIFKNQQATFPKVEGKRIIIQPFTEFFRNTYTQKFGKKVTIVADFNGLIRLFAKYTDHFGVEIKNSPGEIKNFLKEDSKRPLTSDLYTGYAILLKDAQNMDSLIGRASISSNGECGVYLHPSYRGKKLGKEAILLFSSLIHIFDREKNNLNIQMHNKLFAKLNAKDNQQVSAIKKLGFSFFKINTFQYENDKQTYLEGLYQFDTSEIPMKSKSCLSPENTLYSEIINLYPEQHKAILEEQENKEAVGEIGTL